jgi:F0F1-type ATP synthase assembly protein I
MGSGIIYVAIVGMWVAYFVPRWVHSHDEFSGKTVAGTTATESEVSAAIHADLDRESKMEQILLRRRIVFGLLVVMMIAAFADVIFNAAPYTYALLPMTGLLIYIAHIRRQSVALRLQRRRVTQLHRTTAGVSATNLAQVITPKEVREHWIPLRERELTGITILPKGTAQERLTWQPNQVPVPTYVNAPKAVVPKRVIDLTTPGAWTDEQERLAQELLAVAAPSRDEVFDQQLADEAVARLRHDRAANE